MRVAVSRLNIHVLGRSSQALTGEIGLSEIQNVFAEVSICPETMELLQESLRETHLEATAASFSNSWENQQEIKSGPGGIPVGRGRGPVGIAQLGFWSQAKKGGRGPVGISQLGSGGPGMRN